MRGRFRGEIRGRSSRFRGARTMLGLERHCIAASSGVARASRDEMWRTNTRERAPRAVAARLFVRADGRKRPRDATELFFFSVVEKHDCRNCWFVQVKTARRGPSLRASPTPSRRELETSRLGVHGVALPAAEPHAAPRAVVARLEPAHRAELPRRGRAGGGSRRRRVRRHLRRHAIEHRLVEHAGETPRALFALLRAARGPDGRAFFPFQNLPDACARACVSKEKRSARCVVRVLMRFDERRRRDVRVFWNDGVARREEQKLEFAFLGMASCDARSIATRSSFVPSPSSISYSLSSLPPASASALSFSSASRRAAATCFGRGVRWGLRSAMVRQAGEKVGIRSGARTRVASHLTSRVLIDALERLRHSLNTRRLALAHRARLPSDARGGSDFAGANATKNESLESTRRGISSEERREEARPTSQR